MNEAYSDSEILFAEHKNILSTISTELEEFQSESLFGQLGETENETAEAENSTENYYDVSENLEDYIFNQEEQTEKESGNTVVNQWETTSETESTVDQISKSEFSGEVSSEGFSNLMINSANGKATRTNQLQLQRSGLSFKTVMTALEKSVNVQALRKKLQEYNQSNPTNQYHLASAGAEEVDSVFTETVHQFQLANYIDPKQQDGILGQSTLETLGFIIHGLKPKLNSSAFHGQAQLNRSDVKPLISANSEYTSANWFDNIVRPSWLGVAITDGVHILLLKKLREAESWLMNQTRYKGMTPAALGRALGFNATTRYSAARLSASNQAMHGFGLAIDINVAGNPWIGAGWVTYGETLLQERYRMIAALRKAAGGPKLPGETIFAYLHSIAQAAGDDTAKAFSILKQRSDEFINYLGTNPAELQYWRNSQSFADRNPLNGFLNLHPDLVYALRQIAGLAWGAIDFGPRASGDIMHFDLRTMGIGKILCEKIGGFVPKQGHPMMNKETFEHQSEDENEEASNIGFELHEAIGEVEEENYNDQETESSLSIYSESESDFSHEDHHHEYEETDEEEDFSGESHDHELEESEEQSHEAEDYFEGLVPTVSADDLRKRIDEYLEHCKAQYTLDNGTTLDIFSQFRYAKDRELPPEKAKAKIRKALAKTEKGKQFLKSGNNQRAINNVAYGRPKPEQIVAVTQELIDAGELAELRKEKPKLANYHLVRKLQRNFGVGIDCAGYVQLAYLYAYTNSDSDPIAKRTQLGLKSERMNENLRWLPGYHFKKLDVVDAKTGDLMVMEPRPKEWDQSIHTVIIVEHTNNGDEHSFLVDASWGTDAYGDEVSGIARRTLMFNSSSGEWWDIHPVYGTEANRNLVGPYRGHLVKGVYRPKPNPKSQKETSESFEYNF